MKFYTTDKPSDIGRVYTSDGELVATVHQTKDRRIQENTKLFVAAPELLAVCKAAIPELVKWSNDRHFQPEQAGDDYSSTLRLVTAAIAKAEGKRT